MIFLKIPHFQKKNKGEEMVTPISGLWLEATLNLLNGTLEQQEFHSALNMMYNHVKEKNLGKCVSKKIDIESERNRMIEQLFESYKNHAAPYELCRSRFMRKLVKHDGSNARHLEFIYDKIVPSQIKQVSKCERLMKDPAVLLWLRELNATVMNPKVWKEQRRVSESSLPQEYVHRLRSGQATIGLAFRLARQEKWIGIPEIDRIIRELSLKDKASLSELPIEFSQKNIISHFIQKYRQFIASGDSYEEIFRQSLIMKLKEYKQELVTTKCI
jgi:hypothetical protein